MKVLIAIVVLVLTAGAADGADSWVCGCGVGLNVPKGWEATINADELECSVTLRPWNWDSLIAPDDPDHLQTITLQFQAINFEEATESFGFWRSEAGKWDTAYHGFSPVVTFKSGPWQGLFAPDANIRAYRKATGYIGLSQADLYILSAKRSKQSVFITSDGAVRSVANEVLNSMETSCTRPKN